MDHFINNAPYTCFVNYFVRDKMRNDNFDSLFLSNKKYAQFENFRGLMSYNKLSFNIKLKSEFEGEKTGYFWFHSL